MKVAVILGGQGPEHSISLLSGSSITTALIGAGHSVQLIGITKEGQWRILETIPTDGSSDVDLDVRFGLPTLADVTTESFSASFESCVTAIKESDVVFPALHGRYGEDGTIQGFLELLGVAYVGSGVLASATCIDKSLTKLRLADAGIRTPEFVAVKKAQREDALAVIEPLASSWPLFVKPSRGGSSIGMNLVSSPEELADALSTAFEHDDVVLVERALTNMREIECGVLVRPGGGEAIASVPSEIRVRPPRGFYDFEAKYVDDSTELLVPAQLPNTVESTVRSLAVSVFELLDCAGLARVDFFLQDDQVFVNEINTMPGFTDISMYPRMFAASGISYEQLVDDLVREAVERNRD